MPGYTMQKQQLQTRLRRIEGQVRGVARMIDEDKYCVDVLKQTFAVRRAIEKMEGLMLDKHLHTCVLEGVKEGRDEQEDRPPRVPSVLRSDRAQICAGITHVIGDLALARPFRTPARLIDPG